MPNTVGRSRCHTDCDGVLLERVHVGDLVNDGNEKVKTRRECRVVAPEALNHVRFLLGDDNEPLQAVRAREWGGARRTPSPCVP